jgi:hypothetical protein
MRKHVNNVVSFISKNPYSFVLITLIMICASMIPVIIRYLGSSSYLAMTSPYPFGIEHVQIIYHPVAATFASKLMDYIIELTLLLIPSFLFAGFLSYLDSKKDEKNHLSLFFSRGIKKLFRAWGAFIVLTVVMILWHMAFHFFALQFIEMIPASLGFVFEIFSVSLILLVLVFFIFMIFEAVLTKTKFFLTIPASFRKAKKVFGLLFLFSLLVAFLYKIPLLLVSTSDCLATILNSLITILATAFIFYPLYKHASEKPEEKKQKTPKYADMKKATGDYVGSRNEIFHKLSCRHAKRIEYGTETYFSSREEATGKGFAPCKHCKP